jgi:hypothetical protein
MQAAHILRLTPTRVRQLLQGGELEGERDEAGHWLIPSRAVHERLEHLRRESFLEAVGYDPSSVSEMRDVVEVLRSQVEMLRAELGEAHAANRENRRIIAALTSRIPAIEAPASPEPSETPSEATEQPGRVGPQTEVEGTQEPRESSEMHIPEAGGGPLPHDQQTPSARPWWRRVLGG